VIYETYIFSRFSDFMETKSAYVCLACVLSQLFTWVNYKIFFFFFKIIKIVDGR